VDPKLIQKVIQPLKLRSDAEPSGPDLESAYQSKSTKSFLFCLTVSYVNLTGTSNTQDLNDTVSRRISDYTVLNVI